MLIRVLNFRERWLKIISRRTLIKLTEMVTELSDTYLAIGDIGHNDSIARTRGVRKALGTGVERVVNLTVASKRQEQTQTEKQQSCSGRLRLM